MIKKSIALLLLFLSLFSSCSSKKEKGLRIAATPLPQAQMLNFIKPELERQGVNLIVVVVDDYNIPNRALAEKEVDANFFQHVPFMDEQIAQFHYPILSIAKVEIEPMGVYSKKIKNFSEIKEGGVVAVPNDPTNEARALFLFAKAGLITLKDPNNLKSTVLDIVQNPKNLQFKEVDAALLPRILSQVEAAAIPTNYALQINLSPVKDALIHEDKDSPYANVITIRCGDQFVKEFTALKEAMTSEKMREFILTTYKGAVIPAF